MRLQARAERLSQRVFLGGPPHLFEMAGRRQLSLLLSEGLYPDSNVLDIGCGCLRAGYWLIHFLERGRYFGIEPNREMLKAGTEQILEPDVLQAKAPRFDTNPDFDSSVFGEQFDFFLARSVWTHASKRQIRKMLDDFVDHSTETGVFLTSFKRPSLLRRDYKGDTWVGRSHDCDTPGLVHHSLRWIKRECRARGLRGTDMRKSPYNFGKQHWLRIVHRQAGRRG